MGRASFNSICLHHQFFPLEPTGLGKAAQRQAYTAAHPATTSPLYGSSAGARPGFGPDRSIELGRPRRASMPPRRIQRVLRPTASFVAQIPHLEE